MTQAPEPKPRRHATPLVPVGEALDRLLALLTALPSESVALDDAFGRIAAGDFHADADQPAFDRAMMDGFAVRSADCAEPGAVLEAVGAAPAGEPWSGVVPTGGCVRVMTGGVVPPGADAVIPVEDAEPVTGSAVELAGSTWRMADAVVAEHHIARRGSEVSVGEVVVRTGTRIGAAAIGVLAGFGHANVAVRRRPHVAVLPTGTEVVPVAETPGPGQVRNSNSHVIAAMVSRFGGVATQLLPVGDNRANLAAAMREALASHDVLITSGGVSMGDYDLVVGALADIGAEVHFHRVRLKPGKPILCATCDGKLVLGLPGNPVSSYVCAMLFLRPALAALSGAATTRWSAVTMPLAAAMPGAGGRERVIPARTALVDNVLGVQAVRTSGSADIAHFAAHDVLIQRPAGDPSRDRGEPVTVLFWPEAI